MELILKIIGATSGAIALFFAFQQVKQWLTPISIIPVMHYPLDATDRGRIGAEIVNRSREIQYVVRCDAVGTYPLKFIVKKHLKNPFASPSLYKTIRYGVISFPLLNSKPLKLEPYEPIELTHHLSDHPLAYFDTPYFLIEVELSTGRKIRSEKLHVPIFWHISARIPYPSNNHA